MEEQKLEIRDKLLSGLFSGDTELLESAKKLLDIIRDIVDLLNDKYPETTPEELATLGIQLYWDACYYSKMKKEETIALAIKILKSMYIWKN